MSRRYFTPQLYAFLRDLAANNEREWFKANQKTYEAVIREPALDFINDFAAPLAKISPALRRRFAHGWGFAVPHPARHALQQGQDPVQAEHRAAFQARDGKRCPRARVLHQPAAR